jgi:single-strand DNA-binding protein
LGVLEDGRTVSRQSEEERGLAVASLNKVVLAGNLTREPELRGVEVGRGKARDEISICDFGLAVNRKGSEKTDFFAGVAWRGLGENLARYRGKGDAVLLEGYVQRQAWQNAETGENRSRHVIGAQNIQYVDSAGQGFNSVMLAGNITRDPELRFAQVAGEAVPVCTFGLAVSRVRSSKGEAAKGEASADFFDVTVWRELAEIIANYKRKGDGIFLEGRLQYDSWKNSEDESRSKVSVVADTVQFTSSKEDTSEEDDFEDIEVDEEPAPTKAPRKAGGYRRGRRAA